MADSKDGLKWFGKGFDGFPKRLPEDCVEYMLCIVDSTLTQKELLTKLEVVRKEAIKLTRGLLTDYIWQRDDFNLESDVQTSEGLKYLHGLTNYGDSVEDEWLIVYILREISKKFSNIWIKVVDTDGEFLLIEAANALPRWLNPEIADNRIWVNDGKLYVIPMAAAEGATLGSKTFPISRPLTLAEAYETISKKPQILIHSPLIEAEAFYRLRNYPSQINNSLHHARVTIPRKLAFVLHNCPRSIAPAVEAFYLRDPIALKQLQKNVSELILPPVDLVTASVKFTKVLYAQLRSQQFSPPNSWKAQIEEAAKAATTDHAKHTQTINLELGMKVTSGYEILLSDLAYQDSKSVQKTKILLEDLEEGTALPTDEEMAAWPDAGREDDEGWLDINFEDFEKELQGKQSSATRDAGPSAPFGPQQQSGFGDAKTQADLRKMVQRFEEFLNDENAGVDGVEIDNMDIDDDDDDDDDDEDSDGEDKAVSFDEKEFARMMREMMGMPSGEVDDEEKKSSAAARSTKSIRNIEKVDSDSEDEEDEDEGEEIRKVMQRIEAELNEAGALDLDPTPSKLAALKAGTSRNVSGGANITEEQGGQDESDDDVNIDFNLARNLLESFKSQAGMAGPGGNLMGMMGMQMPRDEDSSQSPTRSKQ